MAKCDLLGMVHFGAKLVFFGTLKLESIKLFFIYNKVVWANYKIINTFTQREIEKRNPYAQTTPIHIQKDDANF